MSLQGMYHDFHFTEQESEIQRTGMPKMTELLCGRIEDQKSHCDATVGMHATQRGVST